MRAPTGRTVAGRVGLPPPTNFLFTNFIHQYLMIKDCEEIENFQTI